MNKKYLLSVLVVSITLGCLVGLNFGCGKSESSPSSAEKKQEDLGVWYNKLDREGLSETVKSQMDIFKWFVYDRRTHHFFPYQDIYRLTIRDQVLKFQILSTTGPNNERGQNRIRFSLNGKVEEVTLIFPLCQSKPEDCRHQPLNSLMFNFFTKEKLLMKSEGLSPDNRTRPVRPDGVWHIAFSGPYGEKFIVNNSIVKVEPLYRHPEMVDSEGNVDAQKLTSLWPEVIQSHFFEKRFNEINP